MGAWAWLRRVFGLDDAYVRPAPAQPWRTDWIMAALLSVITACLVLMYQGQGETNGIAEPPLWPSLAAIVTAGVLLTLRRRFPVTVLVLLSGVHFVAFGSWLPFVASTASMQVVYFFGIYSAIAWARRREALLGALALVLAAMVVWLVWSNIYLVATSPPGEQPPFLYWVATVLINCAYFGGAIYLGRQAWLQARTTDELAASREQVSRQGDQLADQAVVAERLRIARDLHDSVAHHISLIGVQTAAARRAMATKPEVAAEAMLEVESMSREAVTELRSMLGSLRDVADTTGPKTIEALFALADEASTDGLRVSYQLVGDPAAAEQLSPMQASNLLRIAQESLTNIRRHSTATEARVVVRLTDRLELEVTDNGHPVPNSGGSGLGQVGIRERVAALGGTVEIGPRATVGYRVLVQIPRKVTP